MKVILLPVLILLSVICETKAFAITGKMYSVSQAPDTSNPLYRRFEALRKETMKDSLFMSRVYANVGFIIYADNRVIGFHNDSWFDFQDEPFTEGKGAAEGLVWTSAKDNIEVRIEHRLDQIYNPYWELLGELKDFRTGQDKEDLFFFRNPAFVDLGDARRAFSEHYRIAIETGNVDYADMLMDHIKGTNDFATRFKKLKPDAEDGCPKNLN